MNLDDFYSLSKKVRSKIIDDTINELLGINSTYPHSLISIIQQEREMAIAARLKPIPVIFKDYCFDSNNKIVETNKEKTYNATQIANVFIDSVKKYGESYYPITGDIKDLPIKHLILFIKNTNNYVPFVQFDVTQIIHSSVLSPVEAEKVLDINPIMNSRYKSLLHIKNLKTDNLPPTYLSLNSGQDIYETSFKGQNPNIWVI